ncbi:hypothetical protein QBC46DRAFT_110314 [Diplogelasinospora grovesii]|uniref:Integral membrane protein n=1 Tax=Diplogelasinospora grovesii TaxID=303347 RepID=A0AAN6S5E9_9PEZI|nr:hypothetical protein QBC46DRAFT_110314 [Diplogelasinospora grovesii]
MAQTTVFPVQSLPACVSSCGVLFDVNGACVPPAQPTAAASVYDSCFCNDARLAPFKTGTAGVCDNACTATPTDLGSIQAWYTSLCANIAQVGGDGATTTTSSSGGATAGASSNGGGGGTWLSTHYQWVIFLVIMVVAIAGIWTGACIWRKKYLRKKDREYALGKNLAHATGSGRVVPNVSNAGSLHVPGAGMFMPAPISAAGVYNDKAPTAAAGEKPKKEKKKWVVKERT